MNRFHRIIAFVLAAVWLPAVVHCGMENLNEATAESGCCSHESSGPEASKGACVADHCEIFDDGHFLSKDGAAKLVAPLPVFGAIPACGIDTASSPSCKVCVPAGGDSPPAELARRWMFELRAAPLANAPGLIVG